MKDEEEIWLPIKDYEGCYEISNYGRVKSLPRKVGHSRNPNFFTNKTGKIMDLSFNRGYTFVRLYKNGKCGTFRVHRLVAIHFMDNPLNYEVVNHLDSNRSNNFYKNLEWCTTSMNMQHAYDFGSKVAPNTGKFGKDNWNSKKVIQKDLNGNFVRLWDCLSQITRELGYARQDIGKCCAGKRNTAYGFIWEFYKEEILTTKN